MPTAVLREGGIAGDGNGARVCGARRQSRGIGGSSDGEGRGGAARLSCKGYQSMFCVEEDCRNSGIEGKARNISCGV